MAFFPGALNQQSISSFVNSNATNGALGYYDLSLQGTNYANQINIVPFNSVVDELNSINDTFSLNIHNYLNINRQNLITSQFIDENSQIITLGTKNSNYYFL